MNVQLKVSIFDNETLVRDEIGDDYTLKVISDVSDDNMTIVCTSCLVRLTTAKFTEITLFIFFSATSLCCFLP